MTDETTTDQPRRGPWVSDDQAPVYRLPDAATGTGRHRRHHSMTKPCADSAQPSKPPPTNPSTERTPRHG